MEPCAHYIRFFCDCRSVSSVQFLVALMSLFSPCFNAGAHVCIIVFSTVDRESFLAIERWKKKVHVLLVFWLSLGSLCYYSGQFLQNTYILYHFYIGEITVLVRIAASIQLCTTLWSCVCGPDLLRSIPSIFLTGWCRGGWSCDVCCSEQDWPHWWGLHDTVSLSHDLSHDLSFDWKLSETPAASP